MLFSYLVILKTSWSILRKFYLPGYTVQGEFLKLCLLHKDVSKEMKVLFKTKNRMINGKAVGSIAFIAFIRFLNFTLYRHIIVEPFKQLFKYYETNSIQYSFIHT